MRIKLAVFAGLLLVFTLDSVNGYAAAIDKDNPGSADVNIVWNRDDIDQFDAYDFDRLDINDTRNLSLDVDKLDNDNLNVNVNFDAEENFGNDNPFVEAGADQFDVQDLPSANGNGDFDMYLNL